MLGVRVSSQFVAIALAASTAACSGRIAGSLSTSDDPQPTHEGAGTPAVDSGEALPDAAAPTPDAALLPASSKHAGSSR